MSIIKRNVRPNHVHLLVSTPAHLSPAKVAEYLKGKSSYMLQRKFPPVMQEILGSSLLWSRGYFSATVGAVTEDQIKQYIDDHSDDPDSFKVWDAPKQEDDDLESDSS